MFYVRKGNRRLFVAKRLFEHGCIDAGSTLPCAWYYGIKPFTAKTGVALRLRGRDFSSEIDVLLLSVKLSFSTVKDLITIQNDVNLQQNSKKSMAVETKQPLCTAAVCVYHEVNGSGDHGYVGTHPWQQQGVATSPLQSEDDGVISMLNVVQ